VSFDTSALPEGASVVSATLRVKLGKVAGTNPFLTHVPCLVDLQSGSGFGGFPALAASDFQVLADASAVASMSEVTTVGQWSEGILSADALALLNTAGRTQFRLYFQRDDNDDAGADTAGFYSGGAASGNKPELIVEYVLPRSP